MSNSAEVPIILIGPHRSGTTFLGNILGKSSGIAYWKEPRQVWSYGNWFKPDDVLTADDVTPGIKRYIRRRFGNFTSETNASRFCEKTPSNCLRVPFVHAIFPEAKFVFLVRDGRDVLRSTREISDRSGGSWQRIAQRIRETSFWELPAMLQTLPILAGKLTGKPLRFWGPRPPRWRQWAANDSQNVIIAKQWAATVTAAKAAFDSMPSECVLRIRFEDLMCQPEEAFDSLAQFLELPDRVPLRNTFLAEIRPSRAEGWRQEVPHDVLEEVRPYIDPVLHSLGYDWDPQDPAHV